MQCGTALRAARDLTGEPCSPVIPFFFGRGIFSQALLGVQGAVLFFRSGTHPHPPWRFSLGPPGGPFSFVPHCAQRSGGPFNLIDSSRPTQGLPASNAALAARPRWAVAASPPQRDGGADRPPHGVWAPRPRPWRKPRPPPGNLSSPPVAETPPVVRGTSFPCVGSRSPSAGNPRCPVVLERQSPRPPGGVQPPLHKGALYGAPRQLSGNKKPTPMG